MGDKSDIEWTDATWNPVRGCTKISPGCKNCYAETFAERWRGIPDHPYEQGFDLRLVPEVLAMPLRWARTRKIFVNSMSDLVHERVPLEYVHMVAEVMRLADWHIFQLLTKRATRLIDAAQGGRLCLPNVIVGVSVEDRRYGVPRIAELRRANVSKRFLSIEPLLEDLGDLDLSGIDWVIVGGESGPGARPMNAEWVRKIRTQCTEQRVAFFFKQWGGARKKDAGRELDGATHDGMPSLHVAAPASSKVRAKRICEVDAALAERSEMHPRLALLPTERLVRHG